MIYFQRGDLINHVNGQHTVKVRWNVFGENVLVIEIQDSMVKTDV